jgi:hypothetical protein
VKRLAGALVLAVSLSLIPGAGAGTAGLPAWDTVPAESPGSNATLLDVTDLGAGNVWAVGSAPPSPLVERWNGSAFVRVPVAGVAGRANVFEGVHGTAPNDAWAVGHADRTDFVGSLSLTYRWNGTAWTRVPSPNSGTSEDQNELFAVAAISPNDAWAVGRFSNFSTSRAITLRWDGLAWRSVPNACGPGLMGVTALASNDVWAVGANVLCHWDGVRWTAQRAPAPPGRYVSLQDVDGVPGAIWAVGLEQAPCGYGYCGGGIVLRRSAGRWVREIEGYHLYGIDVFSPTDAWAVGTWAYGPLLLHRDGASWQPAPTPDLAGIGSLAGVSGASPTSLWAVGAELDVSNGTKRTLALQAPSTRSGAVDGISNGHASVSWFGPESGTREADQFGRFAAGGLAAGRYTFFAAQQGCRPASRQVDVLAGTTIELTLYPAC